MADHYATDEHGFPLRTAERLHILQGGRLTEGDHALPRDLPSRRGNDMHAVNEQGFSRQDWLDAHFELYCHNLRAGMTTDAARGAA
jgi:hypothetical protein